ncbi:MAG: cupin domain-containing protein [Silvibacterium sp.]|nr:cupin domain-containing protein [Silvibacterium sp.]
MTPDEIKTLLKLEPHPCEGGWFRQTWRSQEEIPHVVLPARYSTVRAAGTCIYYLLEPDTFSEMHRLASDEIFHFYYGDPIEMLQLLPDGSGQTVTLGNDLARGHQPQLIVPKNVWQGSRLLPGGKVALLGCTVSPGFEYADYETGPRADLTHDYPQFAPLIGMLTRV